MSASTFWKIKDRAATLERLWLAGVESRVIAERLSEMTGQAVTRNMVLGKSRTMGLPSRYERRDSRDQAVSCGSVEMPNKTRPVATPSITKEMLMAGNGRVARRHKW